MTILDGQNGQPLLSSPVKSAGSVFASELSISTEGHGHDTYLYFILDCLGHEGESRKFKIVGKLIA